jgi:F-type H+-transporting ATPase subunit b
VSLALIGSLVAQVTTTTAPTVNVQSKNPILPAGNEIVWGTFSFLVLFVLMAKFAFPAVRKSMDARTERIRNNLDEAERIRGDAQQILADYQRQLNDARSEANRIIEEARQAAEQLRQELVRRAEAEVAELRQRNAAELRAAQERAIGELQAQVRNLAVDLAEKVVGESLDRERNLRLVDQFIAQLNASPS